MQASSINNSNSFKITKPIVLIGMMGVGKTTFGKKLANSLQLEFLDVDQEIENDIGHTVSWIFQNAGEEEFRKLERKKITEILNRNKPIVLALGGGAYISDEVKKIISDKAVSIWLKASPDTILYRVSQTNRRPLLDEAEDKMSLIKKILLERIHHYEKADLSVSTEGSSHRQIVDNIISNLKESEANN